MSLHPATTCTGGGFAVVVPVKRLAAAKTRLASYGPQTRRVLSTAFLLDTVEAALGARHVLGVTVVTDDEELARAAAGVGGALLVSVLADPQPGDLNAAFRAGAAHLHDLLGATRLLALCGDLPALRPVDLDTFLEATPADRPAFVPDRQASGTTTYAAPTLELFGPRFGPASAARHLDAGAVDLTRVATQRLRCDVDTPEDLAYVASLGVGRHTREALLVAGVG